MRGQIEEVERLRQVQDIERLKHSIELTEYEKKIKDYLMQIEKMRDQDTKTV